MTVESTVQVNLIKELPLAHKIASRYAKSMLRGANLVWKLALFLQQVPEGLVRTIDGFVMRPNAKDWMAQAIYQGTFDRSLSLFFKSVKFNGTFLDVGANLGYYSFLIANKSEVNTILIEPLPANIKRIIESLDAVNINSTLFELALSDTTGRQVLYGTDNPSHSGAASLVRKELSQEGFQEVSVDTFDRIWQILDKTAKLQDRVLIKIDTEGAENKVVAGMTQVLLDARLSGILIEVSPGVGEIEFIKILDKALGNSFEWIRIYEEKRTFKNRIIFEKTSSRECLNFDQQENVAILHKSLINQQPSRFQRLATRTRRDS